MAKIAAEEARPPRAVDPIPVRERYFLTRCEHCGWEGSSESCHVYSYHDDADVGCPACDRVFLCDDISDEPHRMAVHKRRVTLARKAAHLQPREAA